MKYCFILLRPIYQGNENAKLLVKKITLKLYYILYDKSYKMY